MKDFSSEVNTYISLIKQQQSIDEAEQEVNTKIARLTLPFKLKSFIKDHINTIDSVSKSKDGNTFKVILKDMKTPRRRYFNVDGLYSENGKVVAIIDGNIAG